jgi:hypothetical protein
MDSKREPTSPVSERSIGRVTGVGPRPLHSDHQSQEAIASGRIVDRRSREKRRKD